MKKILLVSLLFTSFSIFAADETIKTVCITSLQKSPWIAMTISVSDKGTSAVKTEYDGAGKILNELKLPEVEIQKMTSDKGEKSIIVTYFDKNGDLNIYQCSND